MKKADLIEIIHSAVDKSFSSRGAGENPLATWTGFIDRLDAAGRRLIGDKLETGGRNRYTGREAQ